MSEKHEGFTPEVLDRLLSDADAMEVFVDVEPGSWEPTARDIRCVVAEVQRQAEVIRTLREALTNIRAVNAYVAKRLERIPPTAPNGGKPLIERWLVRKLRAALAATADTTGEKL